MTDRELEQRLRAWYGTEVGEDEIASLPLRSAVVSIPRVIPRPARRFGRGRGVALLAAAALLLVGGALAAGSGLVRLPTLVLPAPVPSQAVVLTPSPAPIETSSVVPVRAPSWTATGSMATNGEGGTATLLRDGRVLVMHVSPDGSKHPAELYDPTTGSWTTTGSTFGGSWSLTLRDGRVLAAGPDGGEAWATSELYDPTTGSWTATGSTVAEHQGGETVTLLPDGRVLLAGGFDDRNSPKGVTASAELYDPGSETWTITGSMIAPRANHTATLLPDGRVLVAGGHDLDNATASAELYDPASGTWTATGSMSTPLAGGTAALMRDGRVLVADFALAGPCAAARCSLVFVAELYDPVTETWTATESTPTPHYLRYSATLLPDGKLLVAGGADSGSEGYTNLASAELYDPDTGTWTATPTMSVAREGHTATLLRDGRVLVAGGVGEAGASAELYDPGSAP